MKIPVFDLISASVIAPLVVTISAMSLRAMKFILMSLEEVATEKKPLNSMLVKGLPYFKKFNVILNEKIFEKGVRTDFNTILAMTTVVSLIALATSISNASEVHEENKKNVKHKSKKN
mmetsp:Transcript_10603/g.15893  ORF Transcript_10603/g.15893 Transcript_10603/m.15893 type:complete len:118 (+) Transcript_10603:48-401(+)